MMIREPGVRYVPSTSCPLMASPPAAPPAAGFPDVGTHQGLTHQGLKANIGLLRGLTAGARGRRREPSAAQMGEPRPAGSLAQRAVAVGAELGELVVDVDAGTAPAIPAPFRSSMPWTRASGCGDGTAITYRRERVVAQSCTSRSWPYPPPPAIPSVLRMRCVGVPKTSVSGTLLA